MILTPLQRAILAALGPREVTTEEVRSALAAARPGHWVTMDRLLIELRELRESGLADARIGPNAFWWSITDAGIAERVSGSAVSPLVADMLLELDKAHEGDETPSDTLRRVIRQAAEVSDAPRLDDLASFGAHVFPGFTGAPTPDNVSEIAAYLEGYVYRLRHGAAPAIEFNGDTPYAKAIPVEGGQNCRVSWERGWKAAHDAMARAEAGRST